MNCMLNYTIFPEHRIHCFRICRISKEPINGRDRGLSEYNHLPSQKGGKEQLLFSGSKKVHNQLHVLTQTEQAYLVTWASLLVQLFNYV
jgi:hypothetical protein